MGRRVLLALCALTGGTSSLTAAPPTVEAVAPGVGQRGTEFTLTLTGARLGGPQELMLYGPGVTCTKLAATNENEVTATLTAAPDCRLGEYPFRLRTAGGASEVRVFHVTPFPVVAEAEPNDTPAQAQPVAANTSVAGTVEGAGADYFALTLKKGQRLAAEVEAVRLGGEFADTALAVFGPDGRELAAADDTPLTRQDPALTVLAPADGTYLVRVREATVGGGDGGRYVLHVGTFCRPAAVFPAGGPAGQTVPVRLLGDAAGERTEAVKLPADPAGFEYYPADAGGPAPTPNPFRVSPFPNVLEGGPTAPAAWPVAFNGVIARPGEVDEFRFTAAAGDRIDVQAFAYRIGSPLDPVVTVLDAAGREVAANDDDETHDSRVLVTIPAAGEYRLRVADKRKAAGPRFVYRVELAEPKPGLAVFLATPARKTQDRQVVTVPRGNRTLIYLAVRRDGFDGPVTIAAGDLPPGVTADIPPVPPGEYLVPVIVSASADAPAGGRLVPFTGAGGPNSAVTGGFVQNVVLSQAPGDAAYHAVTLDKLAVTVTDDAPFTVAVLPPAAAAPVDGTLDVAVTLNRAKDFAEPVEVFFPWLPPGVEAPTSVVIPGDKSEAVVTLVAHPASEPGVWKMAAEAKVASPARARRDPLAGPPGAGGGVPPAGGTGRRRGRSAEGLPPVASNVAPITVAAGPVKGAFQPAAGEPGKAATVVCRLELPADLPGPFTAKLDGLPPRTKAPPVKVPEGARRVEFPVEIDPDTPPAPYPSLVCELAGEVGGRKVVYRVGRGGVLTVNPPGGTRTDAAGKPLSPLDPPYEIPPGFHDMRPAALVLLLLAGPAGAADPAPAKLTVAPAAVDLAGARDRQGLVVQAEYPDGSTRDVTAAATIAADKPVVTVTNGFVAPAADGTATLTVTYAGQTVAVPVAVRQSAAAEPLRFRTDVLPVLTKVGCNTGKCHGSASGKDGFRLSLFGYDPAGDLDRLTREHGGRRVNLATPDDCLLVNKATGQVPHTGGRRIEPGGEGYQLLVRWLEAGAPKDPADTPKPVGIEVYPKEAVFAAKGDTQRMVVRAKYADGTDRDVTRFAVFVGNNDAAATVAEDGTVTGTGPGEAFVLARFDQFTEGTAVIVRPGTPFADPKTPAFNDLDAAVHAKLNKMHVAPSGVCTDEEFVRRASIDLVGLLPTPAERAAFLADADPKKREKLVDRLIARDEFRDIWGMKWAELLQVRTANGLSPKALQLYDRWLRDRVKAGATIDAIVRELLPAVGGSFENPAVNYYQTETTPALLAENVAQVFLGTRVQCAQCHNHPFDRWTMDDYYGFAAFFGQVGYKNAQDPRELTVYNAAAGDTRHPLGDRPVRPKFLGGAEPEIKPGQDYRAVLAGWLATPENPAFARNIGNVVWAHFLGRGVVEPVDDARVSNPAANPALLDLLGKKAAAYKFDVAKLARDVCTSRTYQLSTKRNASNELDDRNFSRGAVRRMRAEVLLDCITQVTETGDRFPGLAPGGRAVQVADGRTPNYFLTTFGRSSRATACACEVRTTPTLSQALHLLNGETTTGKIAEGKVVAKLLAAGREPTAVAAELYVRCLGREPTAAEARKIAAKLAAAPDPAAALDDLFWALLNTNEFLFNH